MGSSLPAAQLFVIAIENILREGVGSCSKNMKASIPFISYDAPHSPTATSNNTTSNTNQTRQDDCLHSFKRSVLRRGNSVDEREFHAIIGLGGRGPPVAFARRGAPIGRPARERNASDCIRAQ